MQSRVSCLLSLKGQARHHNLLVNGEMNPDAVCRYPQPSEGAANLKSCRSC